MTALGPEQTARPRSASNIREQRDALDTHWDELSPSERFDRSLALFESACERLERDPESESAPQLRQIALDSLTAMRSQRHSPEDAHRFERADQRLELLLASSTDR